MLRTRASHAHAAHPLARWVVVTLCGVTAFSAGTAGAASPPVCYNRAEYAAEQTIRLHTEIMVIGLTCQSVMPEQNPFSQYQKFTVKNESIISAATKVLEGHFRRTSTGNPSRRFDTFRTEMANEISRRAAIIGTGMYCQEFVERAKNALALSADDIKVLTADEKSAGLLHLGSRPLCDVKVASMPDGPAVAAVEPARAKSNAPAKTASAKPAAAKPAPAKTKPAATKPAQKAASADAASKPLTTAQKP